MSYSTSGPVETILRKEDTVDPVAGNDNTQGYSIKSRWINTSSNEEWVCTDASTGAALWELTTGGDGDVVGPASAVWHDVAKFNGTTGKLIETSTLNVNTAGQVLVQGTAASLDINERTTGPGLTAGRGKVWVKDDAPTSLHFTDDDGTDLPVARMPASINTDYVAVSSNANNQGLLKATQVRINANGQVLINSGSDVNLMMKERTTGPTGTATYGHIWVKDDIATTLMFTDDDDVAHSIMGDVVGPASSTSNALARYSGTTGKLLSNSSELTYNSGNLSNTSTSANIRFGFHTSSPSIAAGQGRIFVNGSGSTAAMLFKDDTNIRRMDLASSVTMASNAVVDVDATEVVIGGAYIVGNDFSTFTWEILGTYNDNGGTGVQDLDVYLYDRGPDGTPVAGVLRSTLSIDTLDTLDRVSQTLTASGTPGVDTDTIFNTGRLYEVRAKLDAGGSVDTAKLLSVRFIES